MRSQTTSPTTYRITGADGRTYGPVSIDTLRAWTSAGRIDWNTPVVEESTGKQFNAGDLPELNAILSQIPPIIQAQRAQQEESVSQETKATRGEEPGSFYVFGLIVLVVLVLWMVYGASSGLHSAQRDPTSSWSPPPQSSYDPWSSHPRR